MADGYGIGLFDSKGPTAFAGAIKSIATELNAVQQTFSSFGTSAANSIGQISTAIQDLSTKLSGLQQNIQQTQAAMGGRGGGGGGMGAGAQPTPGASGNGGSGGTGAAGVYVPGPGWSPSSEKPSAGPFQGNPSMPPAAAPAPAKQGQDLPQQTAAQAQAQQGQNMWGRAAESILPAMAGKAIDFASGYGRGMVSAAVQGATIGQMEGPAFGVSAKSLYVLPGGTLAQNPQDYAQANYYAMMNMGAAPGTQNWSTINRGANQLMTMVPGMSRQGAMAAQNALQQAPVLNRAVALGMNFRPGGQMQTPEQIYGQIFNRLTMGNKIDAKTFEAMMQPGAPGAVNLQALGIEPGTDEYYGFMQYALTRLGMQKQGKVNAMGQGMPDLGTSKGVKQTPLGNTPYYSQLTAQSAKSRIESQAEPALADAAKRLNDAAGELLSAATHLTGPLGELGNFITRLIPGPGGPGGMVGGALELGAGLWAGKKLYGKFKGTGGKGGGLFGGLFKKMGKGGGAVGETEAAVEDAVAGGGKKGFLGSLMGCFGCDTSGMTGNLGNLFQGGKGKLGDLWGKAKGWMRGGEEGGIRDLLGKILGKDVASEGEKLGMENPGFRGLFSKGIGGLGKGIGNLAGRIGLSGEGGLISKIGEKGIGATLKGGAGSLLEKLGLKGGLAGLGALGAEGGLADLAGGLLGGPVGIAAMMALTTFGPSLIKGGIGLGKKAFHGVTHGIGDMFGKGGGGGAMMGMLLGGPLGALLGGIGGKRIIGGAEDVIGGIGHGIGSVFGGLFGHHKKKQTDGDGDLSLLKNPPKGSALDLLTQKPQEGTMLAMFSSKGQGQGGVGVPTQHKKGIGGIFGSILGAVPGGAAISTALATFFGGTPAAAQTMGGGGAAGAGGAGGKGPYAWNYQRQSGQGVDMSYLFSNTGSSQSGSSSSTSGGSGGTGAGTPTNLTGSGNVQQAYNFLIGKGLKDYQAAGVLGNLAQESGVNPKSQQSGGPGRGIAQWGTGPGSGQRWDALTAWAKGQNRDPWSLATQLDWLWQELSGSYGSVLSSLKGSANVTDATTIFETGYEAAGKPNMANRIKYAQNILGSKGQGYARGTQLISRTQLALLHRGEAVIPAADNYSAVPYNRGGAVGGSGPIVNLNFKQGSIVLQVPPTSSQQDMDNMAKQFVAAISKPQLLSAVRSS